MQMNLNKKHILLIGPTCPLGESFCKELLQRKARLSFLARNQSKSNKLISDLKTQNPITSYPFDATEDNNESQIINNIIEKSGPIDGVIFTLGAAHMMSSDNQNDRELTKKITDANFTSITKLLVPLIIHLRQKKNSFIIVTGSVGGHQVYIKKYLEAALKAGIYDLEKYLKVLTYTSSKLYLHTLTKLLAKTLKKDGIKVLTIKPGTISTEKVNNLKTIFPKIDSDKIAERTIKFLSEKKNSLTIPAYWNWILFLLRFVPSFILIQILKIKR